MSNAVPICAHIKTDGNRCGSPAEGGMEFCYHHSAVKTALGKVSARSGAGRGQFAPIPFVFPEDRASMQINFFLLLQAFNEGRVDLRNYRAMMSLLKSMSANLGKTGSLVEEDRDQGSGTRDQKNRVQGSGTRDQEVAAREASVALSAAAETRGRVAKVGPFSMGRDYGFLPSVMSASAVKPWEVGSSSDPVKEMARQAARVRW